MWSRIVVPILIVVSLLFSSQLALSQTITEYPIPAAGSNSYGITMGPDGALWFTDAGANNIGRITTAGAITEFPIPYVRGLPLRITNKARRCAVVHREFALCEQDWSHHDWGVMTEIRDSYGSERRLASHRGRTVRCGSPKSSATRLGASRPPVRSPSFRLPAQSRPLWHHHGAGRRGVVHQRQLHRPYYDRRGVTTEFPLPTANSYPYAITTGPDGALWFTEGCGMARSAVSPPLV